jgi:hypothetical protein
MPAPPTVTVPGLLSNAKAPHVSSVAAFDTYIQVLNNSGRNEDQATAQALQQISNALSLIVQSMLQSQAFSFNVPVAYHAIASGNLTLTTTLTLVPGLSITIPTSGQYFIAASVTGTAGTADGTVAMALFINGAQFTNSGDTGAFTPAVTGSFGIDRFYVYQATAGDKISVECAKVNNAGSGVINGGNSAPDSTLTAIWLHGGLAAPST